MLAEGQHAKNAQKPRRALRVDGLTYVTKWLLIIGFISVLFAIGSVFWFFVYYQWTMPAIFTIAQPLYFDYQHPAHQIEEPHENVHIHYHVDNAEFNIPSLSHTKSTLPMATFLLPPNLLSSNSAYSFTVHFTFADSPINRQIGMFMMRMNLKNKEGSILSTVSRPTIVPYRTTLQRMVKGIILLIPSLLGVYEETYETTIPCISYFWDDSSDPLRTVQISLSHPDVQLYKATLYIGTELFGIPYALHHYFIFTSFVFLVLFFIIQWIFLLLAGAFYLIRSSQLRKKRPQRTQQSNFSSPLTTAEKIERLRKESDVREDTLIDDDFGGLPIKEEPLEMGDQELSVSECSNLATVEMEELDEAIESPTPTVIKTEPIISDSSSEIRAAPRRLRKRPLNANRTPASHIDVNSLPIDTPEKPFNL